MRSLGYRTKSGSSAEKRTGHYAIRTRAAWRAGAVEEAGRGTRIETAAPHSL